MGIDLVHQVKGRNIVGLQMIWEDKKVTTILCKKHWMRYVLDHTHGTMGSAYYVLHSHAPKWRWITDRKNMYCRECKKG